MEYVVAARLMPDGRLAEVVPLLFGGRVTLRKPDSYLIEDSW